MTDTLDYDDLERLSTPTDEDTDLVRELRGKLKAAGKRAKDRDELAGKVRNLELTGLIGTAGIDGLNNDQQETLTEWAAKQAEVTPEQIHARAVALGWAQAKPDPAAAEIKEHSEINAATGGAPPKGAHQITPADTDGWDQEKILSFRSKHPEAFEQLKRGETVSGIAF